MLRALLTGKKGFFNLHKSMHDAQGKYIKSIVYGGLDGIITTFAVVASVAGASLTANIVLILGFANLFADAVSMGAGDYLSSKAKKEFTDGQRKKKGNTKTTVKQLHTIFTQKGLNPSDATTVARIFAQHKKLGVDTLMQNDLGVVEDKENAIASALWTFFSFVVFGFIPLLAYVLASTMNIFEQNTFIAASGLTVLTLFLLGALKTHVSDQHWFRSGVETILVGGFAATVAYLIGHFVALVV